MLKHATYTSVSEITQENKVQAGEEVFMLACSRCHTGQGVNSVVDVFERMMGTKDTLNVNTMKAYMPNMHTGRNYMPPFPGNEAEAEALAVFIRYLQDTRATIEGAQTKGVDINPNYSVEALIKKQQN